MTRPTLAAAFLAAIASMNVSAEPVAGYAHRGEKDREALVQENGGDAGTEECVKLGLIWLARNQDEAGFWASEGTDDNAVGITGLAVLAFAGAGYGPDSKVEWVDSVTKDRYVLGDVVKRATDWLISKQKQDGQFLAGKSVKAVYNHAIATTGMCEAYGVSGDKDCKESAEAGLEWLISAQNPNSGWRYASQCGDNDTSVTSWGAHALHSARLAGLGDEKGIEKALKGAMSWVESVTDEDYFKTGYTSKGTGKVVVPGKNDDFDNHEALTGAGMSIRLWAGQEATADAIMGGAKILVADLPVAVEYKIDSYYWYQMSQALFLSKGPESKYWKRGVNAPLKSAITTSQILTDDNNCGSWDPKVDRWAFEGGRGFITAMNVLTMEVYYRYKPVAGNNKEK